ncbi:MAG: glutaredoxin family protein [Halieaceae bacterium]|jgi:hypothetical protein|nr:glutaredoxin family protein [Halieaceae bacterium]
MPESTRRQVRSKPAADQTTSGQGAESIQNSPEATPSLVLYSTSACHLCEQAEALLLPLVSQGVVVAVDDISESDALFHQYGMRIPVVKDVASGRELDWPFDAQALQELLAHRPEDPDV